MNLRDLRDNWERLGSDDPLWAILSHADRRGGRWDPQDFFATGRAEVAEILTWLDAAGITPQRGTALDFGCGAGRLTNALADHFAEVVGVDIAPAMVALAERFNHHGPGCRFVVHDSPQLSCLLDDSIDFVLSLIVLQHIEPRYAEQYLRAMVRALRPGGVMVVQIPSHTAPTVKGALRRVLALPRVQPLLNAYRRVVERRAGAMEMYAIRRPRVEQLLRDSGAEVCDVRPCTSAGPTWRSFRYLVRKGSGG